MLLLSCGSHALASVHVIDQKRHHLGTPGRPEWQWFEEKPPDAQTLELQFTARSNQTEATLFIRQEDVKLEWKVRLNGRDLGKLVLNETPLLAAISVPPGVLREGENALSIVSSAKGDDILVGEISLDDRPVRDALSGAALEVHVNNGDKGNALPCRITILNEQGDLAPIYASPDQELALRPGVVYTRDGHARLGLLPGSYTVFATRGFEYGVDSQKISISVGKLRKLRLRIRREVPTPGWVACDTHIHTFTHSRHGDATVEERMLTLAGEGIELPIATDHNLLIDFSETARRMRVEKYFTPVIGDEVTTEFGHFNVFPIEAGSPPPDFHLRDWPKLMQNLRSTPGVQVVILNHPRNIHSNFQPFNATNFNAVSGENLRGPEFSFDAMEVVNSAALQSDWMLTFRDWFALLNHGCRVTAVGSSDSHEVSRFIVGQGRSYVACDDSVPDKIPVDAACESFRQGRVLVSLGLLAQMKVDDKFGVGDLAIGLGKEVKVKIIVLSPSWSQADRVELFANGTRIREQAFEPRRSGSNRNSRSVSWSIPRPAHDVHLVAIASGPGVTAPYWPIARPYQPTSPVWQPRVIGATNPVWVDADGDGKFTSARAYAVTLLRESGSDPGRLIPALGEYDEAVSIQAASLCQAAGHDIRAEDFARALADASGPVRKGFGAFAATLRVH